MLSYVREFFKKRIKYSGVYILTLCLSVIVSLLVGALVMLIVGHNPVECYVALLKGAVGSARVRGDVLAKSVTLMMTGLAMAFAARAGMFNVGGEGQLYLGAMASAVVGAKFAGIHPAGIVALALICSAAAGGAYAFVPAVLKVKLGVSEVITTIMLNTVAILFCSFLVNGLLKTAEHGVAVGTDAIDPNARFSKLIPLSNLTQSIIYAAVIAVIVWYFMSKTAQGYELKLTGQNRAFAEHMGFSTGKIALWAMVVSGALCGLTGMFEVYSIHGRFIENISMDFYFDGMLVAMIMKYNPIGIVFMSIFFAALKIGASAMEANAGVSSELILVVQSIIIFFMAAEGSISQLLRKLRNGSSPKEA